MRLVGCIFASRLLISRARLHASLAPRLRTMDSISDLPLVVHAPISSFGSVAVFQLDYSPSKQVSIHRRGKLSLRCKFSILPVPPLLREFRDRRGTHGGESFQFIAQFGPTNAMASNSSISGSWVLDLSRLVEPAEIGLSNKSRHTYMDDAPDHGCCSRRLRPPPTVLMMITASYRLFPYSWWAHHF